MVSISKVEETVDFVLRNVVEVVGVGVVCMTSYRTHPIMNRETVDRRFAGEFWGREYWGSE
jgi:hypothetical protein